VTGTEPCCSWITGCWIGTSESYATVSRFLHGKGKSVPPWGRPENSTCEFYSSNI